METGSKSRKNVTRKTLASRASRSCWRTAGCAQLARACPKHVRPENSCRKLLSETLVEDVRPTKVFDKRLRPEFATKTLPIASLSPTLSRTLVAISCRKLLSAGRLRQEFPTKVSDKSSLDARACPKIAAARLCRKLCRELCRTNRSIYGVFDKSFRQSFSRRSLLGQALSSYS